MVGLVNPYIGVTMKSHNTLMFLATEILKDFTALATYGSFKRDVKTLTSRVKDEGLSFLTITLANFGDDFFSSIERGNIDSTCFLGFKKHGRIPAFLRGIVSQVFDESTGKLLDEPDILAIKHIRQISYMFKKLKMSCTHERNQRAIKKFIQDEVDLSVPISPENCKRFSDVCRYIWDPYVYNLDIFDTIINDINVCRHGPGATAEGYSSNGKYAATTYHERLEPYFPYLGVYQTIGAHCGKELNNVTFMEREDEQPAKVVLVPKTLKTPRIIAIEPACMQYAQQGLASIIIKMIENNPLCSGHINFKDQSINQRLALKASSSRKYATLDLSSASDRVPYELALGMFASNDDMQQSLDASRSWRAKLPTGQVLTLKKFASMGSAVCFPIESMYFYTICIMAQLEFKHLPVTYHNIKRVMRDVFIYGDDIIVPVNSVAFTIAKLHMYHCKVGTTKSFWRSYFRESCGLDAYKNVNVTPIYIRNMPPDGKAVSADKVISWTKTSNQFYKAGYWRIADAMSTIVEKHIHADLPIVHEHSPALGKTSFQRMVSIHRWGKRYHRPEIRALVAEAVYRKDPINNYHALTKSLTLCGSNTVERKRLERSARHGTARLRYRWISSY